VRIARGIDPDYANPSFDKASTQSSSQACVSSSMRSRMNSGLDLNEAALGAGFDLERIGLRAVRGNAPSL
jgi:hypothetical protein